MSKFQKDKLGIEYYREGKKDPVWFKMILPVIKIIPYLVKIAKPSWIAIGFTIFIFAGTMALVEWHAIKSGHWVYNRNKDFFTVLGIPITEALYYLTACVVLPHVYRIPSSSDSPSENAQDK